MLSAIIGGNARFVFSDLPFRYVTSKPHSDLDLLIEGKEAIPIRRLHLLEKAFADSDLPFRVDVLDWHAISAEFRQQIGNCRKILGQNS